MMLVISLCIGGVIHWYEYKLHKLYMNSYN